MASATDSTLNSLFFVNDQRTSRSFLVDSGAEVSVLPASSEDRRSASNGKSTSLSAANGSSIPTFGKRSLSFQLSGTKYEWSFILANVQRPILGADFLHATGLLIDVRHKRLLSGSSPSASFLLNSSSSDPLSKASEAPGSTSSSRFTLRSTSNHNPQQSTFTCRTSFQARVGSINHFTLDYGGKHQNVSLDRIKAAHVDPSSLVQVAVPHPPLTRI